MERNKENMKNIGTPSLPISLLLSFCIHYEKIKNINGVCIASGIKDGKTTWCTWYGKDAINSFLNRFNPADREFIKKHSRSSMILDEKRGKDGDERGS